MVIVRRQLGLRSSEVQLAWASEIAHADGRCLRLAVILVISWDYRLYMTFPRGMASYQMGSGFHESERGSCWAS